MNVKHLLTIREPIKFYDVCTIYPPAIKDIFGIYSHMYDVSFLPYIMTEEMLTEQFAGLSIFEVLFMKEEYFEILLYSLSMYCRTTDIKYDEELCEIYIGDSEHSLNKHNFSEFADIILTIGCKEKYSKKEEPEPEFETEEGRQKWLKLKAARERNKKNDDVLMEDIINFVQFGGKFYISEELIKEWSIWKLMNSYQSIIKDRGYSEHFDVFLQSGNKELIDKHFTELLKVI